MVNSISIKMTAEIIINELIEFGLEFRKKLQ